MVKWLIEGHYIKKKLVENGYGTNQPDHYKMTPLQLASEAGHLDIVKYLCGCSALKPIPGAQIEECIYLAKGHNHNELAKFMEKQIVKS